MTYYPHDVEKYSIDYLIDTICKHELIISVSKTERTHIKI